jgi:hypothetical protein
MFGGLGKTAPCWASVEEEVQYEAQIDHLRHSRFVALRHDKNSKEVMITRRRSPFSRRRPNGTIYRISKSSSMRQGFQIKKQRKTAQAANAPMVSPCPFASISAQYGIAAPITQHLNTYLKNRVDSENRPT